MNWNEFESQWNQVKGSVREKYNKLTDEDIHAIAGKKDQFISKLQARYSMSREQAQKDVDTFVQNLRLSETQRTHGSGGGSQY
ncbi:MAG TPA: PqqD family peptide modification chaperone [Bryobacteraceae bacterium]|nr:PqqD family peptide modification chaperone [Bryobacteraceae bacterium]